MSNFLAGDFDAVFQLSRGTVNRLLATTHQNKEGYSKKMPLSPQTLVSRIGGYESVTAGEGQVRGTAWVQLSVPTIEIVPNSTEELIIGCWIRARYRADPDTVPLPQFIHGKVRVTFIVKLTSENNVPIFRLKVSDDDKKIGFDSTELDAITEQLILTMLRPLLRKGLTAYLTLPKTLPVGMSHLKGLSAGGLQVLALPLSLPGGKDLPATSASISNILGSSDFSFAISKEYILGLTQTYLDELKQLKPQFHISATPYPDATYTNHVHTAVAAWNGNGQSGTLSFYCEGDATTPSVWWPNADWDTKLGISISFGSNRQGLILSAAGDPAVHVDIHGPVGWTVKGKAENNVRSKAKAIRDQVISKIQEQVNRILPQILDQIGSILRRVDVAANIVLKTVDFTPDGVVFHGAVTVSQRKHPPQVKIEELNDGTGYTAFDNWISGGWITDYSWEWHWWKVDPSTGLPISTPMWSSTGDPDSPGEWIGRHLNQLKNPPEGYESYKEKYADRFVLLGKELPGLSKPENTKAGALCLRVSGWNIDQTTGEEVPVSGLHVVNTNLRDYTYSGEANYLQAGIGVAGCYSEGGGGSPLDFTPIQFIPKGCLIPAVWYYKDRDFGGDWRVGYVDLFATVQSNRARLDKANVIVQFVGEEQGLSSLAVIRDALHQAGRTNAGAAVIVILRQGLAQGLSPESFEKIRSFDQNLANVRLMVTEDIRGKWSKTFGVRMDAPNVSAIRGINARGRIFLQSDVPLESSALARELRQHLEPSPAPRSRLIGPPIMAGERVPNFLLKTEPDSELRLSNLRGSNVVLSFGRHWSAPCLATLLRMQNRKENFERAGIKALAVLTEADKEKIDAIKRKYGLTFPIIPDPAGAIAKRYSIQMWPTLLSLDTKGFVKNVILGAHRNAIADFARFQTKESDSPRKI